MKGKENQKKNKKFSSFRSVGHAFVQPGKTISQKPDILKTSGRAFPKYTVTTKKALGDHQEKPS